jgi:uncharacterized Ntn-hydrolase superfamily protein
MRIQYLFLVAVLLSVLCLPAVTLADEGPTLATFSIVGFDPETGDLGVAVASKFLAVGSVVPWAEAGVGAIATQAYANVTYGPEGLDLMDSGKDANQALDLLLKGDEDRQERQVGIVDAAGRSATFTGKDCNAWAGGKAGKFYACQGNILVGEETVEAMADAFQQAEGELAERLLAALRAGEEAGGDSRGKQSAAILVVREGGGYLGLNDRYVDLRVDDHTDPVGKLARLLDLQLAIKAEMRAYNLGLEGDYEGAVAEYRKVIRRHPESASAYYNMACYLSLAGKSEEALAALEKAVALEPDFREYARTDRDFDPLRNEDAFKTMLEQ